MQKKTGKEKKIPADKPAREKNGSGESDSKLALAGKQYAEISLAEIQVNPDNPRKHFAGTKFDELVASVRKVGVMQPITIRPVKGTGPFPYMIVFGERRYNASVIVAEENGGIKKNTIPSIIRKLTDDEAFDLMTIENLQREDLTELEEAQSFKIFLDKKGIGVLPELAERTGIKPSYIRRRVAVLSLPKEALKAWEQGKILYGHCEQLARLTDKKEIIEIVNEIIENSEYNPMTVKDLKEQISNQAIKLAAAKFDLEKAGCKTCKSNSDVQRDLFDEDIEKSICTNTKCFKQNQNNWLTANWKNEFKKKTGTNGFRFYRDVQGEHLDFWNVKPGEKCKECQFFVSLIQIDCDIYVKQSCVGDKSCYNQIIAAGKKQQQKKTASKTAGSQEEISADTPRVAWHGGFFIEEFYKTAIPDSFTRLINSDMILRFSLMSLVVTNDSIRREFLIHWMPEKYHFNEDGQIVDQDNKNVSYWDITPEKIWSRLSTMKDADLFDAHKEAAHHTIMFHNAARPTIRHAVALHLGISLAREWRITKDYLDKKTTKECLDLIDRLGISTDEKALAYLQETLNKKRGKFNTCKKAELISLILESGIDLAGKVPAEILNAAKNLETPEEGDD